MPTVLRSQRSHSPDSVGYCGVADDGGDWLRGDSTRTKTTIPAAGDNGVRDGSYWS